MCSGMRSPANALTSIASIQVPGNTLARLRPTTFFQKGLAQLFGTFDLFDLIPPGTLGGNNWRWRLLPGEFNDALIEKIAAMTTIYGR